LKKKYRFDIKMMMADCEANYARICRIMPSVLLKGLTGNSANNSESIISSAPAIDEAQDNISFDIDLATNKPAKLSLSIAERCRFTTMVNLQVLIDSFVDVDGESGCVNMSIRLYHDVNMAEVIACNHKPNRLASYEYPNELMFQPDEKAQQNRFLSEWLGLCSKHGMSSESMTTGLYTPASSTITDADHLDTGHSEQQVSPSIDTLLVGGRSLRT
jgi:uncharacterized protein YqiB (DUF1249 family)